jgi:hypothetical protein
MVIKLFLVLPCLILVEESQWGLQTGVVLTIVFIYAVLSFVSKPFIDPVNDRMDQVGRVVVVLTSAISLALAMVNVVDDDTVRS